MLSTILALAFSASEPEQWTVDGLPPPQWAARPCENAPSECSRSGFQLTEPSIDVLYRRYPRNAPRPFIALLCADLGRSAVRHSVVTSLRSSFARHNLATTSVDYGGDLVSAVGEKRARQGAPSVYYWIEVDLSSVPQEPMNGQPGCGIRVKALKVTRNRRNETVRSDDEVTQAIGTQLQRALGFDRDRRR